MEKLTAKAPAKINLALDIIGKREDGYHELRMINHSCGLMDELELIPAQEYKLICNNKELPDNEGNLVTKAVRLLERETGRKADFQIRLKKNIPHEAGLGGGSADAAAAIKLILKYWKIELEPEKLRELALELGADVPYCLENKPALVEGIGEKITELPLSLPGPILIIKPDININTAEAFSWTDECLKYHPDINKVIGALKEQDLTELKSCGGNAFFPAVQERYPVIGEIIRALYDSGAFYAVMSGSGPTIIGYFKDEAECDKAQKALKEKLVVKTGVVDEKA